jgi:hypothetical protein
VIVLLVSCNLYILLIDSPLCLLHNMRWVIMSSISNRRRQFCQLKWSTKNLPLPNSIAKNRQTRQLLSIGFFIKVCIGN